MRKLGIISFILALIADIVVIILCLTKKTVFDYFTLSESRGYVLGERLTFDIYSTDKNYLVGDDNDIVLKYNNESKTLLDIDISVVEINKIYKYEISTDMFDVDGEMILRNCKLSITNSLGTYLYYLGNISILNPGDYTLLGFDSYYASYSIINTSLYLTGINLRLRSEGVKLSDIYVNGIARGNTNLILEDKLLNHEIDIKSYVSDYNILERREILPYTTASYSMFIPIVYDELSFIRRGYITLLINDEKYYIDTFSFIANDLDPKAYSYLRREGVKC